MTQEAAQRDRPPDDRNQCEREPFDRILEMVHGIGRWRLGECGRVPGWCGFDGLGLVTAVMPDQRQRELTIRDHWFQADRVILSFVGVDMLEHAEEALSLLAVSGVVGSVHEKSAQA